MGGVIQSDEEGQFVNYFCPSVFVEGLQFTITWTEDIFICHIHNTVVMVVLKNVSRFSEHVI